MRKSVITKDNYNEYINLLNYMKENKKIKKAKILSSVLVLSGCAFFGTSPLILQGFTSMSALCIEGFALITASVTFIDLGLKLLDMNYREPIKEMFPNIDTNISKKKLEEKINSYEDDLKLIKLKEKTDDSFDMYKEPAVEYTVEEIKNKVKVKKYN